MSVKLDPIYMAKLSSGILDAIVSASMVEHDGKRTAILMTAEVIDVLTTTLAGIVAGSAVVATPTERRRWCDDQARHLQRLIAGFQDHAAAHGLPFPTETINPH